MFHWKNNKICFNFSPIKGDDASTAKKTDEIDLFEEEQVFVKDLNPKTKYILQMIARNTDGETAGEWVEKETTGAGEYNNILAIYGAKFQSVTYYTHWLNGDWLVMVSSLLLTAGSTVTSLPLAAQSQCCLQNFVNSDYTITVQSQCSHCVY